MPWRERAALPLTCTCLDVTWLPIISRIRAKTYFLLHLTAKRRIAVVPQPLLCAALNYYLNCVVDPYSLGYTSNFPARRKSRVCGYSPGASSGGGTIGRELLCGINERIASLNGRGVNGP